MTGEKILLKNATLITETGEVIPGQDVVIAGGLIKSISKAGRGAVCPEDEDLRTVDCSGYYVSCGLPNMHCHCAMSIFRGIAEDVTIDSWFNEKIFPYESRLEPEDVYVGTKMGIAEMLNCGVTAFADHYFEERSVLKAVKEMGIRADIAPTLFGTAPNFAGRLKEVSDFCEENKNASSKVAVRMGPHAPYTCPPDTLRQIAERAKELDLGLHIHISETEQQVKESYRDYGKSPFAVCYDSGMFDRQVFVAHGLWLEDDDIKYLGDDTWFALCTKTYAKLASGVGGAFRNRKKLKLTFGTDGAASSNTLNPIEQARLFALFGKQDGMDSREYETREIWQALMRGHEALSFGSGKMAEGAAADIVIWDLKKPNTWPVYDPVTSILYSSDPSNVLYTMVAGEFLKDNGRLVADEAAILDEVDRTKEKVIKRGSGAANVHY